MTAAPSTSAQPKRALGQVNDRACCQNVQKSLHVTCETDLVSDHLEKVSTNAGCKTRHLKFDLQICQQYIGLLQAVAPWHADALQPLTLPAYLICKRHTFGPHPQKYDISRAST